MSDNRNREYQVNSNLPFFKACCCACVSDSLLEKRFTLMVYSMLFHFMSNAHSNNGMLSDTVVFGFTLLDTGAVLFLLIYFVLILSDLECDYINAQQCCSKLNFWSIPKVTAHVITTLLLAVTGHWMLFLVNIPFVGYLLYESFSVPRGNLGIYDPAEIHNRGQIKKHMSSCMIFLGFYLLIFFIYLYNMIRALLKDDPIRRHENDEIISEF